nr:hypothetical protein CR513_44415 [Ipomoea batatas]
MLHTSSPLLGPSSAHIVPRNSSKSSFFIPLQLSFCPSLRNVPTSLAPAATNILNTRLKPSFRFSLSVPLSSYLIRPAFFTSLRPSSLTSESKVTVLEYFLILSFISRPEVHGKMPANEPGPKAAASIMAFGLVSSSSSDSDSTLWREVSIPPSWFLPSSPDRDSGKYPHARRTGCRWRFFPMFLFFNPLEINKGGVIRDPQAETVALASIQSFFLMFLLSLVAFTPKHLPLPSSTINFSALQPVKITAPLLTASTSQVESVPIFSPVLQPNPQDPQPSLVQFSVTPILLHTTSIADSYSVLPNIGILCSKHHSLRTPLGVLIEADQFIAEPPPSVVPAWITTFPSVVVNIPPDSYISFMEGPSRPE